MCVLLLCMKLHWMNTLQARYPIFLCFLSNLCTAESAERSFPSRCPSKNHHANWYTATGPAPSPGPKETLHRGTAWWERVRTAGIPGGIKSAILLPSPRQSGVGERLLLAQVVGAVVQGLGQRAVLVPKHRAHTLVSLSGCTTLKLWLNSFQLHSTPSVLPKDKWCIQVTDMTRAWDCLA